MKSFIAAISLGFLALTGQALAQTAPIEIGPTPVCYGFCWNVPNSAGDVIDMSPPPSYPYHTLYVSINGVAYSGPLAAGTTSYSDVVALSATGEQVLVSATWTATRKCSSGRGGGCATVYSLVSGTIQ